MKKSLFFALIALCVTLGLCFAQKKSAATKSSFDVDLTRMSSTMVYAKVFNMLTQPEQYEGKTVRMRGNFDVFEYEENDTAHRTFACIIQDATACCAQGMVFALKGNPAYPQDYPERFAEITVTGTFHQEEEDGLSKILLVNSTLDEK